MKKNNSQGDLPEISVQKELMIKTDTKFYFTLRDAYVKVVDSNDYFVARSEMPERVHRNQCFFLSRNIG